jgi:lipopolysaccharide biosynthesis glycosyltransferase
MTQNLVLITSFDANYFKYSMVAIKSFAMNYNESTVLDVVCLVPEDILHREREYSEAINQENLKISFRASEKYLKKYGSIEDDKSRYFNQHCHHRMFLGSACKEYDRAIYIDPDTITLRDVSPIINYPFINKFNAVIEYTNANKIAFNDEDRPYFNNGVFLADLKWWRDSGVEDQMVEWLDKYGPTEYFEQDAMNAILLRDLSHLPVTMNFFNYKLWIEQIIDDLIPSPMIVHFVGKDKPWTDTANTKYDLAWLDFYQKFFGNLA